LINAIEECDEVDEIVVNTAYGVVVYDTNGTRVNGINVKLRTYKEHCDGSIGTPNGSIVTGVTGYGGAAPGFFGVPYYYGYTIKTKQDALHFKATISKNGKFIDSADYIYSYNLLPPSNIIIDFHIDPKWSEE
jgi:hypothetical protein